MRLGHAFAVFVHIVPFFTIATCLEFTYRVSSVCAKASASVAISTVHLFEVVETAHPMIIISVPLYTASIIVPLGIAHDQKVFPSESFRVLAPRELTFKVALQVFAKFVLNTKTSHAVYATY